MRVRAANPKRVYAYDLIATSWPRLRLCRDYELALFPGDYETSLMKEFFHLDSETYS